LRRVSEQGAAQVRRGRVCRYEQGNWRGERRQSGYQPTEREQAAVLQRLQAQSGPGPRKATIKKTAHRIVPQVTKVHPKPRFGAAMPNRDASF
jgi:hypothetical protein